jgi:hypothetical protein
MRWAGNVAVMGKMRNAQKTLVSKTEENRHLEDLDIDAKIIL